MKVGDRIKLWSLEEATKTYYLYARFGIMTKAGDEPNTLVITSMREDSEEELARYNGKKEITNNGKM